MRALLLVPLLVLPSWGYCWELGFTSRTYLSPTGWTEELGIGLVQGPWEFRAGAGLDAMGFVAASLEGRYQTASLSLWGGAEFAARGFSQGTVGAEICLTESLGFSVDITVDNVGFAGATLSLWYETGVAEGSSGFTGLLELDRAGAVVGQTLRFGFDFPPLSLVSTAWFDETGFAELELTVELVGDVVAMGVSSNWTPEGLGEVGGSLSGTLEAVVISGEISWMGEGYWTFAGMFSFGDRFSIRGEMAHMEGRYNWEAETGLTWAHVELRLGIGFGGGTFRYTGGLWVMWNGSSLELKGSGSLLGDLELEVSLNLSVFLE